jgi:hypothetical protein
LHLASWDATVGSHDTMPRDSVAAGVIAGVVHREYPADQPWCFRIDITVGAHEPRWDGAHPLDDAVGTGVGAWGGHDASGAMIR